MSPKKANAYGLAGSVTRLARCAVFLTTILSLFVGSSKAATYYVDFAAGSDANPGTKAQPWNRAPGMTGFTGNYSHSAGDVFVFKGGVTWTGVFPWNIANSGASGAIDIYTTDHSWYSGTSWTQPVMDAGQSGQTMLTSSGHHWTVNDMFFKNCGTVGVATSAKCWILTNTHDIAITNNTFSPQTWIGIWIIFTSSGSYSNWTITGNDFSNVSGAVWFAPQTANVDTHRLIYNNNVFHDFGAQIGSTHGDGAFHYYGSPSSDSSQYLDNMVFCSNRFYGDFGTSGGHMTAMFFAEGGASGTICNNDVAFNNPTDRVFEGLISISAYSNSHSGPWGVYNNSWVCVTSAYCSAGSINIYGNLQNTMTFKNNIVATHDVNPIYLQDATSASHFTSDYNIWTGASASSMKVISTYYTYAGFRALGYDSHSAALMGQDPLWVSAPGNEHLQAGSVAFGSGINLSGLCSGDLTILCYDREGNARPSGSAAWDLGPYNYSGQVSSGPAAPTNLNAIVQ